MGSLQARFRRFKRKPGSDLMLYRALFGQRFSPAASDYFARVADAGGTVTNKSAVADYVDGLVALGGAYWDAMTQHCLFVGVSFEGCFVPLRDGMTVPTNNNFVSGDHSSTTGLTGNGSTKFIHTNLKDNSLPQNDYSFSVWNTVDVITSQRVFGLSTGFNSLMQLEASPDIISDACHSSTTSTSVGTSNQGLNGSSRSEAGSHTLRSNGVNYNVAKTSTAPTTADIYIFRGGATYASNGLASYHIGPAIDLSELDTLQSALIAAL